MLAKETAQPFDDADWVFEVKWDGYRAIAELNDGDVKLYSRNANNFAGQYPAIVEALKKIPHNAILDGEIVVLDEKGRADFQKLQYYSSDPNHPLYYYVFDLLELDGQNTRNLTLLQRKELLKELVPPNSLIRYSEHVPEKGKAFFKACMSKNLEGMMAKKADEPYAEGKRTGIWLKVKHFKTADVVVAGYTAPSGARKYFGSLVLGAYEKGKLKYRGHAGTGFDEKLLRQTFNDLQPLVISKNPFDVKVPVNATVTWVKPVKVAEIRYSEITKDNIFRHPSFGRWRSDKEANETGEEQLVSKKK